MPSITELSVTCVILLGSSIWAIRRRLQPKPLPGIPHYPVTSFLGDIPAIDVAMKNGILSDFLHKCVEDLGPIYQVLLGPSPMVVIADPYEIEDIQLRGRGKVLDASDKSVGIFGGITPNGQVAMPMNDLWKKHRRIGGPFMSSRYLKQMTPRIADDALALVAYWKDKMNVVQKAGAKCFECQFDFQLCTMDVITEVAFGERHNGVSHAHSALAAAPVDIDEHGGATFPTIIGTPFHRAIAQHMRRFTTIMKVPPFLWKVYWFIVRRTSSFRSDDNIARDMIRSRIEQARARAANVGQRGSSEAPDCALDMIVEKDQQDKTEPYTSEQLEDEMMDYVFAGYDTTAASLAYGVKFLMNNPAVQLKLHDELMTNLIEPENRALMYDEIAVGDKTPYLEAVVHELLRVALIGAGNNRELREDMVILGKVIPKGTELLLLTGYAGLTATKSWAASRAADPAFKPTKGFWDDETAADFIPERWLVDGPNGSKVFSISQGYSQPYGLGAKSCFGSKLATLEIKVVLATLNLAFYLDKVPQELNGDKPVDFVTRKPKQCYLSLVDWEDVKRQ